MSRIKRILRGRTEQIKQKRLKGNGCCVRSYSGSLRAPDRYVALSPVILIDLVLVDVEPVRGVHKPA